MNDLTDADRRVLRTRAAIRDALVALIAEKGFDALTVKDITSRADINRGTFYLHYHDKLDLLEQTGLGIVQDFEQIIMQLTPEDVTEFRNIGKPLPVIVTLFEYLYENAALMHAILGLKGDVAFQTQLKKAIQKNLSHVALTANIREENYLVPGEYLISYILAAHMGVIQAWLQRGCVESPKEMATILSRLSFYGPFQAIGISTIPVD
jgi:AcrR family transcriptional regulator